MKKKKTKQKLYLETYPILNVEDGLDEGWKRVTIEAGDEKMTLDMPAWELDASVDEAPTDMSESRNRRAIYIVDKLYDVLKEHEVRTLETGFILQKLISKLEGVEKQAISEAFGVETEYDIRITHWDKTKK